MNPPARRAQAARCCARRRPARPTPRLPLRAALLAAATLALVVGPAGAQVKGYDDGRGGSPVRGAAGPAGASGDEPLETCARPLAALAVVEPQGYVSQALSRYGLQSPTRLIRLMVQQSNCFVVVERGIALQNMMQERELAKSGELRQGSNVGGGQMLSADFVLTPTVEFAERDAGGLGGALGGLVGNRAVGAVLGGLKFREAQTSMLLADARSGVQVAAAEGHVSKADFALGGVLAGGGAGGGLGGYTNTSEGKVVAAGFLSNYNKLVRVVRGDPSLQRQVGTLREEAGHKVQAGVAYAEGDVVIAKIGGVKLLAQPADGAKATATLARGEELVFLGQEQDGWLHVQGTGGEGWVRRALVGRR